MSLRLNICRRMTVQDTGILLIDGCVLIDYNKSEKKKLQKYYEDKKCYMNI